MVAGREAATAGRSHQLPQDPDGEGREQDFARKHSDQLDEGRDVEVRQEVQRHRQRQEGLHHCHRLDQVHEGWFKLIATEW